MGNSSRKDWTARIGGIDEPASRQARMLLVWVGVCFPDPRCWGWVAGWDAVVAGGHCWLGLVGCFGWWLGANFSCSLQDICQLAISQSIHLSTVALQEKKIPF